MRRATIFLVFSILFGCDETEARVRSHRRVMMMEATAYARARQDTAAGTVAKEGTVAADPAVLPLGTRIRISGAGAYNGNYLVTDTGAAVKGRHIDLYLPSRAEAKRFGTKTVRVEIRQMGDGKEDARAKNAALPSNQGR